MEFKILGPLEVRFDGRLIRLGGERQRKLLAVLLLHTDVVVPFDRLIDELWPDPPPTARRQIYNAAAALRRCIAEHGGPSPFPVTTAVGYQIRLGDHELDAAMFDRSVVRGREAEALGRKEEAMDLYSAALALWRGPVLDSLNSPLIDSAAEALGEQRLAVLERVYALRMEFGEYRAVSAELRETVAAYPLRESLRAKLMLALARSGRQAEALAVYEEGRRLFADELGLDPGTDLRELHDRILAGEHGGRTVPVEHAEVVAPVPAGLSSLPYDSSDFTGRTDELDLLPGLIESVPDWAPAVIAVGGMGGVGKTALAVHVARRLAPSYPDGIYFVDLHGFTENEHPVTSAAALDQLLRQSGMPIERIPGDPDTRQARWLAETSGKKVLVVLDNAADAAQIRPLLPSSPEALVLVTSRRHLLALEGAIPLTLDVLSPAEGVALFTRIAGEGRVRGEQAAVADVVRLCGGLPLAIRIAGSRLSHRLSWTTRHLADQLRDRGRRGRALTVDDRSVAGVLTLSYQHLPAAQRLLFRLLALAPGRDIDAYAAAALADLPLADAEDGLEDLVGHNLLLQRAPGRYLMHDLVRDCARQLSAHSDTEAELHAARHRLFDYYLEFAHVRCLPIAKGQSRFEPELRYPPAHLPESDSEADDIEALKVEQQNLVAVAEHAAEHGWDVHAWQLPCLLLPFFARINYRMGSMGLYVRALHAARSLGNRRGESAALANIALSVRERGNYEQVEDLLTEAIAISKEIGDVVSLAYQQNDLGVSQIRAGRFEAARTSFTLALRQAEISGDKACQVTCSANLGVVCAELGRHTEALAHFEGALRRHRRVGYVEGELLILINIGWVLHLRGRDREAVLHLSEAAERSPHIGFHRGESLALAWLAVSRRCLGQHAAALHAGNAALDVARRADLKEAECEALNAIAETHLATGDVDMAVHTSTTARQVAVENGLPLCEARAMEGLAHAFDITGDVVRARRYWERALVIYPSPAADADNARAHLDGSAPVRCRRCATDVPNITRAQVRPAVG